MAETYRIKEGLPGLSGLHVVGDVYQIGTAPDDEVDLVHIDEIIDTRIIIGDRMLRYPMPSAALYIDPRYLEKVDMDPDQAFTAETPFGEHLFDGQMIFGNLVVSYSSFENATTVTVVEKNPPDAKGLDKTLYSHSFFGDDTDEADKVLLEIFHGEIDPDDIILCFKNLHEDD